jgi:hypothetical protein
MADAITNQLEVTPHQMLRRGIKIIGLDCTAQDRRGKKANVRVFKSHYSIHPNQASNVWKGIIHHETLDNTQVDLKVFFISLNFL